MQCFRVQGTKATTVTAINVNETTFGQDKYGMNVYKSSDVN
jgi:hypothetical protein